MCPPPEATRSRAGRPHNARPPRSSPSTALWAPAIQGSGPGLGPPVPPDRTLFCRPSRSAPGLEHAQLAAGEGAPHPRTDLRSKGQKGRNRREVAGGCAWEGTGRGARGPPGNHWSPQPRLLPLLGVPRTPWKQPSPSAPWKPNSSRECHHARVSGGPFLASPPHTSPPPPEHRCPGTGCPPETTLLPPPGWQGPAGRWKTGTGKAHGDCAVWPSTCTCVLRTGPQRRRSPCPGGHVWPNPPSPPAGSLRPSPANGDPGWGARAFDGRRGHKYSARGQGWDGRTAALGPRHQTGRRDPDGDRRAGGS